MVSKHFIGSNKDYQHKKNTFTINEQIHSFGKFLFERSPFCPRSEDGKLKTGCNDQYSC